MLLVVVVVVVVVVAKFLGRLLLFVCSCNASGLGCVGGCGHGKVKVAMAIGFQRWISGFGGHGRVSNAC